MLRLASFPILFLALSNTWRVANAAACSAAQLQGDFNKFRVTGGMGVYDPGSNQVVSFDHPTGSPVTGLTGVTVVPSEANTPTYNPTINSGLPTPFSVNGPDSAGSVNLNLPVNLPTGQFRFRLALTTTTGACTLDSSIFTSTGDDPVNQCSIGQSQCTSTTTFVSCVATGSGNVFGGVIQTCGAGTSCVQTGSVAVCSLGNPGTSCTLGNFRCIGSGFQQCYQSASGNAWTDTQACATGTACQLNGNSISCLPGGGSSDVCVAGEKRCTSSANFQVCTTGPLGNLVWGDDQACSAGTSCTGSGVCSLGSPSDCTPGYMQCISSTTWRQCSADTDGGWSFGDSRDCPSGTTCGSYLGNYIICG